MRDKIDPVLVINSVTGAVTFGGIGSLAVAIGAAIRNNNVSDEALSLLAGGATIGALSGFFGCIINMKDNTDICLRITLGVANAALALGSFLAAPAIGKQYYGLGEGWGQTVVDELIGVCVLSGGALSLSAAGAWGYRFFSKKTPPPAEPATSLANASTMV